MRFDVDYLFAIAPIAAGAFALPMKHKKPIWAVCIYMAS
jgi:hypothetical protein